MKNCNPNKTWTNDKFKDECGVLGICCERPSSIAPLLYYGLFALQHRGQESCGMAIQTQHGFKFHKDLGCVGDVFVPKLMEQMSGKASMGIGHVRYATAGSKSVANAQPFLAKYLTKKISVVHNGNLTNAAELKEMLKGKHCHFEGDVDSEIIAQFIAYRMRKDTPEVAVTATAKKMLGAFSVIIMTESKMMGLRDPYGIRPLCIGKLVSGGYVLSSESCGLDAVGAKFIRDVEPGELVVIENNKLSSLKYDAGKARNSCIFEYVYFARPDSVIDGLSVHEARMAQGRQLWKEHRLRADVVFGTPDSGICAALGYASASGIPYTIGFIKNKYIARTFIKPTQELREKDVYIKLNPLKENVKGKTIILVDDSIVRGTTSLHLVRSLRNAGAKKIYLLSASPMIKWPCFLGVDTPDRNQLIAAKNSLEKMQEIIKCDYLGFLSIEGLLNSCGSKSTFCTGCFSGTYPVRPPVTEEKKKPRKVAAKKVLKNKKTIKPKKASKSKPANSKKVKTTKTKKSNSKKR